MTIKVYNPEVAAIVGIQAASLLSQIKYWYENYNVQKVYRTNKQMSKDFGGSLSESQIQRAKKKLQDAGLIIVSHDLGHTRTTHYSLTDKAKSMLGMVVGTVKKVAKKLKEGAKKAVKKSSHKPVKGFSLSDALKQAQNINPTHIEDVIEEADHDFDEHFKALDIAMESCLSQPSKPVDIGNGVISGVFNRIPNIDLLEKKRKMLDDASRFYEDY